MKVINIKKIPLFFLCIIVSILISASPVLADEITDSEISEENYINPTDDFVEELQVSLESIDEEDLLEEESSNPVSVYAYDKDNNLINAFWKSSNHEFYIFMTSGTDIKDVDLYYKNTEDKLSMLENAFADANDIVIDDYRSGSIKVHIMQSSLASVYITLNNTTLATVHTDKEIKYPGNNVSIIDPADEYSISASNVEFKGRGNSSWIAYQKKGYQIKFEKKTSVLGMAKAKKWILLPSAGDASLMKSYLAFNLSKKLGMAETIDARFVDLWVDGEYRGSYLLSEKVEIGENRVELTASDAGLFEYDDVFYKEEAVNFTMLGGGEHFVLKDSVDKANTAPAVNTFKKKLQNFYNALGSSNYRSMSISDLSKYIDVKSFAIYYLVNEYFLNKEGIISSFFWYTNGSGDVIHLGPVWDFDSCADLYSNTSDYYVYQRHCFKKLLSIPSFANYVNDLYKSKFSAFSKIPNSIDYLENMLSDSAAMNYTKWPSLGTKDTKGNVLPSTYAEGVKKLRNWFVNRNTNFSVYNKASATANVDQRRFYVSLFTEHTNLKVYAWSTYNGQDDLHIYNMSSKATNSWTMYAPMKDFNNAGVFQFDVYSGSTKIDSVTLDYSNITFDKLIDVNKGTWYYDSVKRAYDMGIMTGYGNNYRFGTNNPVTRAQFVTVLHNMEGRPEASSTGSNFSDVKDNLWYTQAVNWASANNIVSGYGNGRFGVNDYITREQAAVILANYAAYKGIDTSSDLDLDKFADSDTLSDYSVNALKWCSENSIISGKSKNGNTIIDPKATTTRAQCAAICINYLNSTEASAE